MKNGFDDHIVVGVDGSTSRLAIDWAADEAVLRSIGVLLVHVAKRRPTSPLDHDVGAEDKGHALLARASRMAAAGRPLDLTVRSSLVEGEPAELLTRLADHATALVVGSHRHNAVGEMILGSVSRACVERSTRPVCVVSPRWPRLGDGRIVVGVDGSTSSLRALEWARAEATLRHTELDVVQSGEQRHLVTPALASAVTGAPNVDWSERQRLDEAFASTLTRGDVVERTVETVASADRLLHALLQAAAGADLLVVGADAGRRTRHGVAGSVGRHCVRHAPCPVVVVPSPE